MCAIEALPKLYQDFSQGKPFSTRGVTNCSVVSYCHDAHEQGRIERAIAAFFLSGPMASRYSSGQAMYAGWRAIACDATIDNGGYRVTLRDNSPSAVKAYIVAALSLSKQSPCVAVTLDVPLSAIPHTVNISDGSRYALSCVNLGTLSGSLLDGLYIPSHNQTKESQVLCFGEGEYYSSTAWKYSLLEIRPLSAENIVGYSNALTAFYFLKDSNRDKVVLTSPRRVVPQSFLSKEQKRVGFYLVCFTGILGACMVLKSWHSLRRR